MGPEPPQVLLVDNVDSFTYNVADLLHRVLGRPPVVWRHDHPAGPEDLAAFAAVVVGPGPGRPQVAADMGLSDLVLRQDRVPVLGVCLGHQGLAHAAGEQVVEMGVPRHGIVSEVEHDGTGLFEGVPSPLRVVRYHSLEVAQPLTSALRVTARALDDGSVMALADPDRAFWGVQFHPESVLSEHGELILANFLRLAGVPTPISTPIPTGRSVVPDRTVGRARPDGPSCQTGRSVVPDRTVGRATAPAGVDAGPVAVGDTLAAHGGREGGLPARLGVCRVPGPVDAWTLREALLGDASTSAWLDASDGTGWSVMVDARGPLARELEHRVGDDELLLDRMDQILGQWCLDEPERERVAGLDLPFAWRPGLVGYWGYELKAEVGGTAAHRSPWPDAWLILADRGVVLDHASGEVYAVWLEPQDDPGVAAQQQGWAEAVRATVRSARDGRSVVPSAIDAPASSPTGQEGTEPQDDVRATPRHDETGYLELVRRAQRQIARGESYEICLTRAYDLPGLPERGVDEGALYREMREVSPVPRGAWLRTPTVGVLSGSPERFVAVRDGVVEARPIKGTRPRGRTPEEDSTLAADLAAAQKDRAENLMIVDLLRNDLHRVCRSGSVEVPQIFAVETYATVHQLVSTIRGRLAEGMGPTDVLRACFPGGSMTGAPKVRTMEILDELEGAARGVYSGAIGWVGIDGSMDTSIVIRTAVWDAGHVSFGVGGAVTALSDPGEEHRETVTKASSILRAARLAVGRVDRAGQSG